MKISIHPLFFIFGLYFALTGKVFLFLTTCLTALVHELGHAVVAERLGYKMNKITLMPYGAVVNGAIEGLSYKDEIAVALAGPLTNLFICVLFTALWWMMPECYLYTDTVVLTNLTVASINLLPAYPLDGGRVFCAFLSCFLPRERALKIVKIIGLAFCALLFGLFIFSCFRAINLSLAFFSAFMLFGSLVKTKQSAYVKIFKNRELFFTSVKPIKRLAVNGDIYLKQLLSLLPSDSFFELVIIDKKNNVRHFLDAKKSEELISSYLYYDKIVDILPQINAQK